MPRRTVAPVAELFIYPKTTVVIGEFLFAFCVELNFACLRVVRCCWPIAAAAAVALLSVGRRKLSKTFHLFCVCLAAGACTRSPLLPRVPQRQPQWDLILGNVLLSV